MRESEERIKHCCDTNYSWVRRRNLRWQCSNAKPDSCWDRTATSIASSGHTQNDFLSTINWLLKVNFHWQWIWDWMTHLCSTSHLHASRVRGLLRASSRWASGTGLVAGLQYRIWGDLSSLSGKMPFSYSGAAQKGKMLETRFCLSFSLTAISSRHVDACSACCLTIRIIKNPITPVLFLLLWEKKKIKKTTSLSLFIPKKNIGWCWVFMHEAVAKP